MNRSIFTLGCSAAAIFSVTVTASASQHAFHKELTRRPYVRMAAASDLYEIRSSQLALQRSLRPEVREFAQTLNIHHQESTRQLMDASRTLRMAPVRPTLTGLQTKMIRELRRARPSDFDMLFVDQQIRAHEIALRLHQKYVAGGDTPALRRTAEATVPVIRKHLDWAIQLKKEVQLTVTHFESDALEQSAIRTPASHAPEFWRRDFSDG